jgi:hypothetical protein
MAHFRSQSIRSEKSHNSIPHRRLFKSFNEREKKQDCSTLFHFLMRMEFVKRNSISFTNSFNECETEMKAPRIFFIISLYNLKKRKQLHGCLFKHIYECEKTRSLDNLFIFREFEKILKETPLWFLFRK